jgi:hypothetical protein
MIRNWNQRIRAYQKRDRRSNSCTLHHQDIRLDVENSHYYRLAEDVLCSAAQPSRWWLVSKAKGTNVVSMVISVEAAEMLYQDVFRVLSLYQPWGCDVHVIVSEIS